MRLIDSSSIMNNNNDEILHVIYDYTSKEDDELTLKRGSILEVLSKDERISGSQGWWTGRLIDSESVGIFPANFVASSEPNLCIIDYKDLQIGELIGFGGFGHVYCGKFGDVDVAIKTAKSLSSFSSMQTRPSSKSNSNDQSDAVHKNLIDGLLREARLFSNLNHRNIIQLFGVSPHLIERNLYLVMEYAHGGALNQLLQQRKSGLYPHVFIRYARQIVDGMKYLHDEASEHIIHRDLKCSNILIREIIADIHNDNELLGKTLKIIDFGLAKKQLQSSSTSAAGTFAWMSPECIRSNEFSPKSDVWSFGVLLWECLTGEIPYQGFDQMQVAFGVATSKYSLPIPSTCPEEFSQLMKDCWQRLPQDRPTFSQLYEHINTIIETNYPENQLTNMQPNEESYSSLQQDWRREIQVIFDELKTKEQEIRDREQAMFQMTLEHNHQRTQLEKWEHELHERELLVIERELSLLITTNNQERLQQQTPKAQNRSGRFMRSLLHSALNGSASLLSATATNLISSPTNFRHLISVCRENDFHRHHQHPALDCGSSSPAICPSTNSTVPSQSSNNGHTTSSSTPTTPNLNRLRTLTSSGDLIINRIDDEGLLMNNDVHSPIHFDGLNPTTLGTPPAKPPRCPVTSQTKSSCATLAHSSWRKPKSWSASSTSSIKRKHGKTSVRPGEAKWYIETISSINTTHDSTTISSTKSTPAIDGSNKKSVSENSDDISSSSSSTCSTPNDRSLARAFSDFNSVLASIGLGRRLPPPPSNSSPLLPSTPSSISSSTTPTSKSPLRHPMFRSASETKTKQNSSPSSSTNTTPSPLTKKQHKRSCSTPTTEITPHTNGSLNIGYRARPSHSPVRPNSLVLSSMSPSSSSSSRIVESQFDGDRKSRSTKITSTPEEDEQTSDDDDNDKFYSAHSSKISTPMIQSVHSSTSLSHSQPQSKFPCILDIDSEEQVKHQTNVLPPETERKKVDVSHKSHERDFLH